MAIVRIERYARFTNVPNEAIEDDRLSFRARGVLVYLLSKPDHWTARSEQLVSEGREGRDAIRTALRELETYGYLERTRERIDGGRIVTVTIIRDLPKTGFQASVDQSSGNQASTANTEQQTLSSKGRKKTSSSPSRTRRRSSIHDDPDQSKLDTTWHEMRPETKPQPAVEETPRVRRRRKHQEEHIHAPLRRNEEGLACYWCVELEKVGSLEPDEEAIVKKFFRAWLERGLTVKLGRAMVDAFFADLELAESTPRWKRFVANAEKLRQRVLVAQGGVVPGVDEKPPAFAWIESLPPALRAAAMAGEDVA